MYSLYLNNHRVSRNFCSTGTGTNAFRSINNCTCDFCSNTYNLCSFNFCSNGIMTFVLTTF